MDNLKADLMSDLRSRMPSMKDQEVTIWFHKHIRITMNMMTVPKVVERWITAISLKTNQRRTSSRRSPTSWMGRIRCTTEHQDHMSTSKRMVLNSSLSDCKRASHRIRQILHILDKDLERGMLQRWVRNKSLLCFLTKQSTRNSAAWRHRQSWSQIHIWILLSWRNKHWLTKSKRSRI